MEIENQNSENKGILTAKEGNKEAGKMTYSIKGEKNMVLEHTEVDPDFQGQGVGKELVQGAADFARNNNLKIVAECSYANKIMHRSSNYDDILA